MHRPAAQRLFQAKAGKERDPPTPDRAVKALVEVREQRCDTSETGWTEVDTVAHFGDEFLNFHFYPWLKNTVFT